MTAQEVIKIIKNEHCGRCDGKFVCDGCYIYRAIEALGKQIPKKPIPTEPVFMCYKKCPNCNETFDCDEEYYLENGEWSYCGKCGQKLDWGE